MTTNRGNALDSRKVGVLLGRSEHKMDSTASICERTVKGSKRAKALGNSERTDRARRLSGVQRALPDP